MWYLCEWLRLNRLLECQQWSELRWDKGKLYKRGARTRDERDDQAVEETPEEEADPSPRKGGQLLRDKQRGVPLDLQEGPQWHEGHLYWQLCLGLLLQEPGPSLTTYIWDRRNARRSLHSLIRWELTSTFEKLSHVMVLLIIEIYIITKYLRSKPFVSMFIKLSFFHLHVQIISQLLKFTLFQAVKLPPYDNLIDIFPRLSLSNKL